MRLLLDTQPLLWALGDPDRLAPAAAAAIEDPENEVVVSAATVWEIAIKQPMARVELPGPAAEWLPAALEETGIGTLDVTSRHALMAGALAPHHRDPVDRLLIAQAVVEGFTLVARDERFAAYPVALLRA